MRHLWQLLTPFVFMTSSTLHTFAFAVDTSQVQPLSVTDNHGNTADQGSVMAYRPVNGSHPKGSLCTNCVGDGGIRHFLDLAKSFAHVVLPGDYPYELVDKVSNGRMSDVIDDKQKLINDHIGWVICLGIGVLFVLIFPIVGCCFGCCRCCGRCGGSRRTDGYSKTGYARSCLSFTLFLLVIFVCTGGIMLLMTSNSISDGLTSVQSDTPTNLDSLTDFFNDTTKVIRDIATTDVNFTRDVIFRDLDNIGHIFGGGLRDQLKEETKDSIDKIRDSVGNMDTAFASLKQQIPEVNQQLDYVKSNITSYVDAMGKVKTDFTTGTGEPAPGIDVTVDPNKLDTFEGTTQLDKVGNLTETLDKSLGELDDIPEQVHNKSTKPVSDLKTSILDYTSSVTDTTDGLDFADKIKTDDVKDNIIKYTDDALKYDKYRKYAGQGLGGIVLLIAALLLLGLLFGMFGSSGETPPHERGCASNSGGNCLMAAVVLTFVFGSVLMLMTTLLFAVGTPIETYGCKAFEDTSIMDELIDKYHVIGSVDGSGTYLGKEILDDPNKNMTLTEILSACKDNQAVYKAFRINESDLFNISEILDYKSKFSVKKDMSSINVDYSEIKVLTPSLKADLKDFNDSIQYNFTKYKAELNRNATKEADDFLAKLQRDAPTKNPAVKTVYDTTITNLTRILDKEGKELQESMALLDRQIDDIDASLNPTGNPSLSQEIGLMQDAMSELDDSLETAGNKSFNKALELFTDRIFGIVDSYIGRLLHALDNDIGKCYPVWDTYSSLLIDNICGTLVASVNGFWFALGWSLFFLMPSIVVAVKLAAHFRTLVLVDDMDESFTGSELYMEMGTTPNGQPPKSFTPKSNKVAPYGGDFRNGYERYPVKRHHWVP